MRHGYKPSLDRTFKRLPSGRKKKVTETISFLIDFFGTGKKTRGLGSKNLRGDFWEIRANIKSRIIFVLRDDTVSFVVVGTDDEIQRFLRAPR